MDTDRAAPDLLAIEHEVVRLSQGPAGIALDPRQVLVPRRGERVMHGLPAALVRVAFEERTIDDPEHGEAVLLDQPVALGQLDAEAPDARRSGPWRRRRQAGATAAVAPDGVPAIACRRQGPPSGAGGLRGPGAAARRRSA